MEHPILFINLLLEKLGIHVPELPSSFFPGALQTICCNRMSPTHGWSWLVVVLVSALGRPQRQDGSRRADKISSNW